MTVPEQNEEGITHLFAYIPGRLGPVSEGLNTVHANACVTALRRNPRQEDNKSFSIAE